MIVVYLQATSADAARVVVWEKSRRHAPTSTAPDVNSNNTTTVWEYTPFVDQVRSLELMTTALLVRNATSVVLGVQGPPPAWLDRWIEMYRGQAAASQEDSGNEEDDATICAPNVTTRTGLKSNPLSDEHLQQILSAEDYLQVMGDIQFDAFLRSSLSFCLEQTSSSDGSNLQIALSHKTLHSRLWMDRTAMQAIHLLPPTHAGQALTVGGNVHNNSLYGLLKQPLKTPMGSRLMKEWLLQPLTQLEPLLERQAAVAILVEHHVWRDALRDQGLRGFSMDVGKLAERLRRYEGGTFTGSTRDALSCLYNLHLLGAQHVPALAEHLAAAPSDGSAVLTKLTQELIQIQAELQNAVQLAYAILDLDAAPREFLVQASYKDELVDLQQELAQNEQELTECHEQMNHDWATVAGVSNAVRLEDDHGTLLFRLPNTNDSKTLQGSDLNVKVHKVLKNGVYFSTTELRQLSSKKEDLLAEYDQHQRQVVVDAMSVASTYANVLERVSHTVAVLDVLVGLAHTAATHPQGYVRPELTDGEEEGLGIQLQGARHPCVELQESMEYIPNDVNLTFGQSSFQFVTGPNMGGKSCYIRSIGAIVAMAQIGSFVPCTSAKINLCHHILARVGAGDLQEKGISTFMAEMLESSSILRTASKRSLIIIDELGRGTSTFDGYGLARAISEYIVQKIGCMTVFATHFHELTALEEQEKEVKNYHVTAQKGDQGLTFLYQVRPGPCLESFGIQVAEMANMPRVVVEDAKVKAAALENFEYGLKDGDGDTVMTTNHEAAERASTAVAFVNSFRHMPLANLLTEQPTDELKKAAILSALATVQ